MAPKIIILTLVVLISITGCSSEKFLEEGDYLLTSVKVTSDDKNADLSPYRDMVKQSTNSKWFNILNVPLGIYCLSGTDTTKKTNRFFQRLGEAPITYQPQKAQATAIQMTGTAINAGYLQAHIDTRLTTRKHKAHINYHIQPGPLYRIRSIGYNVDDAEIDSLIRQHKKQSLLYPGMPCNANTLDAERDRIINLLYQNGYYKVLKKYIYYDVDSTAGPNNLDLILNFCGKSIAEDSSQVDYNRYWIGNITVNVKGYEDTDLKPRDSIKYRGIWIRYYGSSVIRPNVIYSQLEIQRGSFYNQESVRRTYDNLSRLQLLHNSSIHFTDNGNGILNTEITLNTNKLNQISAELEGTNTSGDLGMASSVSFTHRNLFHGSETWSTKAKAAFEAIRGLEGYSDQNFFEFSVETKVAFPRIIIPFLSERKRITLHGNSEISLQFTTQQRPEFHRRVLTALWSYKWNGKRNRHQHKLDAIGLNYVYMPWISKTFRENYLENNNDRFAIVKYSYENLFILNTAYNFIYNSSDKSRNKSPKRSYQIHYGIESAGNSLYLISKALNVKKDSENRYNLFNVAFAQYLKLDADYACSIPLNKNNTLAMRGAVGLVLPYGNNNIVPYEKRYFAGGANSVRGWSVRELGPGSFKGEDGKIDFINHTGNLKLLFNLELRSYLIWKLSGALFVDAGNIWTTRNYAAQPGGQFKFDTFYKQIAASYGCGFRFNFDYFILRFDMAMKAISPYYSSGKEHYPLLYPSLKRDFTFHFAVGLPF